MSYYKIKLAAIYKITIKDKYYIGMSVDTFNRWQKHYIDLKMNKHSSTALQKLYNQNKTEDLKFEILEAISLTQFKKNNNNLKGKKLKDEFRKYLLQKEKNHMASYSISNSLNKDNKHFKKEDETSISWLNKK